MILQGGNTPFCYGLAKFLILFAPANDFRWRVQKKNAFAGVDGGANCGQNREMLLSLGQLSDGAISGSLLEIQE